MMKTLCVVAVVLSLTSVCRSASLACEKLLKPLDKPPDFSGRWYIIAMSSDTCLVPALFNAMLWPSVAVDITAQTTPKFHNAKFMFNMYGYCGEESENFLLDHNKIHDVDSNNAPEGESDDLLQTGCPDCLVIKGNDIIDSFLLLSRRKTVSAAEMTEFETQSYCLGWSKPQVLNTDHEYVNCTTLDDDSDVDASAITTMMYERLKTKYTEPLQCITQSALSLPGAAYEWAKDLWSSLW